MVKMFFSYPEAKSYEKTITFAQNKIKMKIANKEAFSLA